MAIIKRVPKVPLITNRAIQNLITRAIKQGETLKEIGSQLKKQKVKFTQGDLENAFRTFATGKGFANQLDRFKSSDRLPQYFFQPMKGNALYRYKVNTTLKMYNETLGLTFYRSVNLEFRYRPTKGMINGQLDFVREQLKSNSDVTIKRVDINFFSDSLMEG